MGLFGERDALLIVDKFNDYADAFPLKRKTAKDALYDFNEYFGNDSPTDVYIWSDSAHELTSAVKTLGFPRSWHPGSSHSQWLL